MLATSLSTNGVAISPLAIIVPPVRQCPLLLLYQMPMPCPTSGKESRGSSSLKERCAKNIDICQTSITHCLFQNGKAFAPFAGFSDTIWQQRVVEDSVGKGKRDRLFQTVRHPDFDPSTMEITSESKRRKLMKQLPGPVSGDF